MAHSSFIDCEVGSSLTENFMTEADLKVEIETQQVNDDENVAVEVLGQLSGNCDVSTEDMSPLISIKTEETSYTYVHDGPVETCEVIPDVENTVIIGPDTESAVVMDLHDLIEERHEEIKLHVKSTNVVADGSVIISTPEECGLQSPSGAEGDCTSVFETDKNDYLMCCTICGLTDFSNEIELQNHIFLNHNNGNCNGLADSIDSSSYRPYKCDSCHMMFQRKSSLKNHLKIHTYGITMDDDCDDSDDGRKLMIDITSPVVRKKRKRAYKREVNHVLVDTAEMPPYEILKPNGTSTIGVDVTNFEASDGVTSNNTFDDWNLDEKKLHNPCESTTTSSSGLTLKPISELTDYNALNHDVHKDKMIKTECDLPINNNNKDKPYICPFCNRTFAREKALLNHMRIHNDNYDLTLECQKCHDVFDDIISLQAHLVACVLPESTADIENNPLPPLSPDYVPYEHKRYNFNNNSNENLSIGEHVCDICNKRFKTRQKVFRHMWVHRKKIYTCEICGLPFPGVKYLDEHRLALHPSKAPFTCATCGKSFMSKQGLTEHSRLHKGWSDQYYCSFCQKYFSSRQGFTIHGRIHTGERPYGCKYCTKSFRDGGTLKKHERIHTGERPHECPLCHKRYNQKVVLREHIRGVHVMKRNSEINGSCPICNITNMDKEELSEHIVRHSDELMKKVKQEFLSRQKSLEKNDIRGTVVSVGMTKKRRNRVLKKANCSENRLIGDKPPEFVETKSDDVYPYKTAAPPAVVVQRTKRKAIRRRVFDKRNTVVKMANQKKKVDRFETKKGKKILKRATKKAQPRAGKGKNILNNIDDSLMDSNTMESGHFMDAEYSSNSSDQLDDDGNKKSVVDFTEELQPLKLLECEMCHARFATRSELITHVLVHI